MTNLTETQKQELVDFLVTAACEDTNFLECRMCDLAYSQLGVELYESYLSEEE